MIAVLVFVQPSDTMVVMLPPLGKLIRNTPKMLLTSEVFSEDNETEFAFNTCPIQTGVPNPLSFEIVLIVRDYLSKAVNLHRCRGFSQKSKLWTAVLPLCNVTLSSLHCIANPALLRCVLVIREDEALGLH
eukprot:1088124-Amphidinium_carterae.1